MAAKAANSEKLREEVGLVFELLQEQITKAHEVCLQRRREIECCVQQCRTLLKPWPRKSSMDKKVDDSYKQYSDECLPNEELSTQEEKGNIKSNRQTEETEKQDLAELDSLLAKAQRARETLNKINETDAINTKKTKTSRNPLPIPNKVAEQQAKKQFSTKTSKPSSTQSVPVRRPAPKKAPMKSTYSASYGRPLSAKSARNQPPGIRRSAKMVLDSVMKKDASERDKHVSAREKGLDPSKTAVRPSLDKKQFEETPCHELQCEEKFSHSSADNYSTETIYPVISKPKGGGSSSSSRDFKESDREISPAEDMKRSTGSARVGSSSFSRNTQSLNNQVLSNQNEGFFDPFADGTGITLPGKYRKLKVVSARLYSELRKLRGKVYKPSSSLQHFVERLEARFNLKTSHNQKEIHEEACRVLREHKKLYTLTEAVVCRTNNLTASSSWQETYKCYRHWQIVLSRFNELQRKTQQLLEAEEQLLAFCPCGNCVAFDQDIQSQDPCSVREQSYSREGCVLLSNWLPAGIEERALAESAESAQQWNDTDFTYGSVKELHRLVTLQHEVQLLCFQLYVEEQAGEKLLPLLEQLDPADSLFVPLYRVIYGLLCGGGKVFPAMVLDNFS